MLEVACLSNLIAAVGEPTERIGSGHRFQGKSNGQMPRFMRSGSHTTQKRFEFGEGFFTGRGIRRRGRQEEQFTTSFLDELAYARSFMDAHIVQHHDLSG